MRDYTTNGSAHTVTHTIDAEDYRDTGTTYHGPMMYSRILLACYTLMLLGRAVLVIVVSVVAYAAAAARKPTKWLVGR